MLICSIFWRGGGGGGGSVRLGEAGEGTLGMEGWGGVGV